MHEEEEADFLNTPHTSHLRHILIPCQFSLVIDDEDDDDNDDNDNDNQTHDKNNRTREKEQNKKGRLQSAIFFRLR